MGNWYWLHVPGAVAQTAAINSFDCVRGGTATYPIVFSEVGARRFTNITFSELGELGYRCARGPANGIRAGKYMVNVFSAVLEIGAVVLAKGSRLVSGVLCKQS